MACMRAAAPEEHALRGGLKEGVRSGGPQARQEAGGWAMHLAPIHTTEATTRSISGGWMIGSLRRTSAASEAGGKRAWRLEEGNGHITSGPAMQRRRWRRSEWRAHASEARTLTGPIEQARAARFWQRDGRVHQPVWTWRWIHIVGGGQHATPITDRLGQNIGRRLHPALRGTAASDSVLAARVAAASATKLKTTRLPQSSPPTNGVTQVTKKGMQ